MSVLWVAVPVALLMASAAVMTFLWVVWSGQLDDLVTPPIRILLDDDVKKISPSRSHTSQTE